MRMECQTADGSNPLSKKAIVVPNHADEVASRIHHLDELIVRA